MNKHTFNHYDLKSTRFKVQALYLKEPNIYTCTAVLYSNELKDLYMDTMLRKITMKLTYKFLG